MEIKHTSNKEDFINSYFSKIFWEERNAIDFEEGGRENITKIFDIENEKSKSIKNITQDIRKKLYINNISEEESKYLNHIGNFYSPVNNEIIEKIINNINKYLDRYFNFLKILFPNFKKPTEIEISFIKSEGINFFHAFVFKFIPNKIFLFVKEKKTEELSEKILIKYTMTVLHEFTHLLINEDKEFQEIMKSEWENKFKNIPSSVYKNRIEEIIVSYIINANRNYGFCYEYIGFEENKNNKKEEISKNKFKRLVFNFLENLEKNNNDNKLKKYLPEFIEELINEGMFKK